MTRDEFLKAFFEMASEDQEAIRAVLVGSASTASAAPCSPAAMKHHMMEMMKKMETSDEPMACCQEMMGMCQEMIKERAPQPTAWGTGLF